MQRSRSYPAFCFYRVYPPDDRTTQQCCQVLPLKYIHRLVTGELKSYETHAMVETLDIKLALIMLMPDNLHQFLVPGREHVGGTFLLMSGEGAYYSVKLVIPSM